ncbi:hypothetical protein [Nocardioides zeicaulis]|uniref:Uncharacterized protein n=1 Tax=Nocardioides zeicaulis TaxID=1776857 RepID=A0ABV6E1H4_9ACTN
MLDYDEHGLGQHGVGDRPFDLGVFMQGDVWRDEDGWTYFLDDLAPDDRLALAGWLRRHSRHFYLQAVRHELAVMLHAASATAQSQATAAVPDIVFLSADEWLAQTALFVALSS